jgi:hypothetical protein
MGKVGVTGGSDGRKEGDAERGLVDGGYTQDLELEDKSYT